MNLDVPRAHYFFIDDLKDKTAVP